MKNPILIGGCGSSGTTLLRKMLNGHPNLACGPEMSVFDRPMMYTETIDYLYTLWRAQDFDPLDKWCIFPLRMSSKYAADVTYCGLAKDNNSKHFLEPEEIEGLFDGADTIMNFLDMFFSKWAEKVEATRWCEKTPNNVFCADHWLRAYPDGKYLNLVRDGRDVVLSLNSRRKTPVYIAIYRWVAAINKYIELLSDQEISDRVMTVRYEELVAKPEEELEMVCFFLGEKYDPEMLKFWEKKDEEKSLLKYGTQPVNADSVGIWRRDDYDHTILHQIMIAIKPLLESIGYEIE